MDDQTHQNWVSYSKKRHRLGFVLGFFAGAFVTLGFLQFIVTVMK